MVANEELVSKHQRHLVESQNRERRLVEDLEKTKTGVKKYDVELKACKEVIDAANETIVLKVKIFCALSIFVTKWKRPLKQY